LFRQKSSKKPYILIWSWLVVPFILASLPGLRIGGFKLPLRPFFFWRYLIPSAIPFSILIAGGASFLPKVFYKSVIGLILILSLVVDYMTFTKSPVTFRQVYENEIVTKIKPDDKIVTVLPSFAEVLYYRNRNHLDNDLLVLSEGLVQFSGKSLLDAYVANGVVKIVNKPQGRYFELRPGPTIIRME